MDHIAHFKMIRTIESKLIARYIDSGSGPFLDLGCGNGEFGKSLGLEKIYGIDIDVSALKKNIKDGNLRLVVQAVASNLPFHICQFGIVFSNCAVEHMDNIDEVLSEVWRILKFKGRFILTVPTPEFMKTLGQIKLLKKLKLNTSEKLDEYNRIHHHVNIYNKLIWIDRLESAGFRFLRSEFYLSGFLSRFVAMMDMLYTHKNPEIKKIVDKHEIMYRSIFGLPMRLYYKYYLYFPYVRKSGTHLILEAEKREK